MWYQYGHQRLHDIFPPAESPQRKGHCFPNDFIYRARVNSHWLDLILCPLQRNHSTPIQLISSGTGREDDVNPTKTTALRVVPREEELAAETTQRTKSKVPTVIILCVLNILLLLYEWKLCTHIWQPLLHFRKPEPFMPLLWHIPPPHPARW